MSIRPEALAWFEHNHGISGGAIYCSRLYEPEESWTKTAAWWHEVPLKRLKDKRVQYIRLLCQQENKSAFHYLRVPKRVLEDARHDFELTERSIRLHLSAEPHDRFTDLRGPSRFRMAEFLVEDAPAISGRTKATTPHPTVRRYTVYVIELSPDAAAKSSPKLPPLYVGQTAHTAEYRFEQHRSGHPTAASKPHRYGVRLRPDLYGDLPSFRTRAEAELHEARLASLLEKRGHRVFWG